MDIFTAIAVPTRRKILEMLAKKGQLSATDIAGKFPVSPPAISQHLKILRDAHLIRMEKRGQQRLYHMDTDSLRQFERWTDRIKQTWTERLNSVELFTASIGKKRKLFHRTTNN